jgi:hypothetical protein
MGLEVYLISIISSGLGLEFSEMVPLVYDEIGNFSSTISSFFLKIIFIVKYRRF